MTKHTNKSSARRIGLRSLSGPGRALFGCWAALLLANAGLSAGPSGDGPLFPGAPAISLELRDTDVRDALRLVAQQGGINLVMGSGVEGPVTLKLEQTSLQQTLDAISEVAGLHYTVKDSVVTVNTLEEVRAKQQDAELNLPPREALVVQLKYVDAERMVGVLEDVLSEAGTVSLLQTSDHVAMDQEGQTNPQLNNLPQEGAALQIGTQLSTTSQGQPARSHTLVVVDRPDRLLEVQRVVDTIDKKPVQVIIEARFVEVTLDDQQQLGVDWNVVLGGNGANTAHTFPFGDSSLGSFDPDVTGGGSGTFPGAPNSVTTPVAPGLFTFGALDFTTFSAVLEAIRTDRRMEVVSNPHIVVGDRHTATILVGERFPILSANVSEFGTVTEQLERYEPIGVQLEVTPSVLSSDEVELYVRPSTSSLGALVAGSTGLAVARINSRQIDTSVTIKDQQTVVLGGLITSREVETQSSVPLVGAVPLLGRLFRHNVTETERVDLMVFLTVAIVNEQGLTEEQQELFGRIGPSTTGAVDSGRREANDPGMGSQPRAELAFALSPPVLE